MGSCTALSPRALLARLFPLTCVGAVTGIVAFLCGCEYEPPTDDTGGGSSASSGAIQISDTNNFSLTAHFELGDPLPVAASTSITISWEELTKNGQDVQCYPIDDQHDNNIDNVMLIKAKNKTHDEVLEGLASNDASGIVVYKFINDPANRRHSVSLSEFEPLTGEGSLATDFVEESSSTFLLNFARGTTTGRGARSLMFLEPKSDSTNTTVEAPSGCKEFVVAPNLQGLEAIKVPVSSDSWIVDFKGITRTGQNTTPNFSYFDELWVAHYAMSAEDLQDPSTFLQLDTLWDARWTIEKLKGLKKTADLSLAKDKEGRAFSGFTGGASGGTWVLALLGTGSTSYPVPYVLTILKPTAN